MLQKVKSFFLARKKQRPSKTPSKQSKVRTRTCKICFGPIEQISVHTFLFEEPNICQKCFRTFNPVLQRFSLQNIDAFHIYYYDDKVKELLYQFKGCFDIELGPVFLEYFQLYLKAKYFGYIMVPAPSFKDADEERGFNHVEVMFSSLGLKMLKCIHKTKNVKQADLTKEERSKIKEVLVIDDVDLSDKKILLVDDVLTTGSTMNAMIDLVKSKDAKKIKILVMSRTRDLC